MIWAFHYKEMMQNFLFLNVKQIIIYLKTPSSHVKHAVRDYICCVEPRMLLLKRPREILNFTFFSVFLPPHQNKWFQF